MDGVTYDNLSIMLFVTMSSQYGRCNERQFVVCHVTCNNEFRFEWYTVYTAVFEFAGSTHSVEYLPHNAAAVGRRD